MQEGGPLTGSETELLSNTRKCIARGDICADKARDFIGKEHPVESSRVREPRRTALLGLTMALANEGAEILSVQERDESLESFYISLVGGSSHA